MPKAEAKLTDIMQIKVASSEMSLVDWSLRARFGMLFVVAAACWLLETSTEANVSLGMVMILALSHCFFSYLYRYRAKGYEPDNTMLSVLLLFILMTSTRILPDEIYIAAVASYFVVHFVLDEAFLSDQERGWTVWVRMLPVVMIYWSYYLCYLFSVDFIWCQRAGVAAMLGAMAWVAHALFRRRSWGLLDWHCLAIFSLSYGFVCISITMQGEAVFEPIHFLVICHVVNWYIHHALKLSASGNRVGLIRFGREIFWVNTVAALGFILYYAGWKVFSFLGLFYQPVFFYIWILVHFFSSLRPNDFRLLKA